VLAELREKSVSTWGTSPSPAMTTETAIAS